MDNNNNIMISIVVLVCLKQNILRNKEKEPQLLDSNYMYDGTLGTFNESLTNKRAGVVQIINSKNYKPAIKTLHKVMLSLKTQSELKTLL